MKRRHDEKRIQRNKVPIWMYDELKKKTMITRQSGLSCVQILMKIYGNLNNFEIIK